MQYSTTTKAIFKIVSRIYYAEVSALTAQRYSIYVTRPPCEVFTTCSPKAPATEGKLKIHSAKVNCYIISCLQELMHTEASFFLRWEQNHSLSWPL